MKRYFVIFLVVFIVADIAYSYKQFESQCLEGDMALSIVPNSETKVTLENPLGLKVFTNDPYYSNPNRFFSHWIMFQYFNHVPLILQKWFSPIDSVYASCAIEKIIIQILLLLVLSIYITKGFKFWKNDFILVFALITPFFQTSGYRAYMGIIDWSPTYTFFYALPFLLLLIYFLPFYFNESHPLKPDRYLFIRVIWILLGLVVCLSGPINPGIILVLSCVLLVRYVTSNFNKSLGGNFFSRVLFLIKKLPNKYWIYILPVCVFSLYSLYVGKFNSQNASYNILALYKIIPGAVWIHLTHKLGFPLFVIMLILNTFLIKRKFYNETGKKIISSINWFLVFILLYILLLPLGGYRDYRPQILRYDTILPITIGFILLYAISSIFLLRNFVKNESKKYALVLMVVALIFTISDNPEFDKNKCERESLIEIANSTEDIVGLENQCPVLSWHLIKDPSESSINGDLMQVWHITKSKKLYYNKTSQNQ